MLESVSTSIGLCSVIAQWSVLISFKGTDNVSGLSTWMKNTWICLTGSSLCVFLENVEEMKHKFSNISDNENLLFGNLFITRSYFLLGIFGFFIMVKSGQSLFTLETKN
ncbi:uncharacterized protein EV154DRAFT_479775 [Mucor mucedo]|uniref:uncharacterized protein n=1 Tax=Mucor mucedo TaxID=29922 RepID=UPI00221EBE05|nr:uncharacterized protein EV154DRAFT_479775 [Mucor mucedo]KAI7893104.1 hypothetical protein EV154DRAFT_479775 [Mucor mucedo]